MIKSIWLIFTFCWFSQHSLIDASISIYFCHRMTAMLLHLYQHIIIMFMTMSQQYLSVYHHHHHHHFNFLTLHILRVLRQSGWAIKGPFSFSSPIIATNPPTNPAEVTFFIINAFICWNFSGILMLLLFHYIIYELNVWICCKRASAWNIKGFPLNFVQIWEILSGENDKEILPGEEWEISVLRGYEW